MYLSNESVNGITAMRFIVAKNIRTDAIAMIIGILLDDETKREALGKTTVSPADFVSLQEYCNPRDVGGIDSDSLDRRRVAGGLFEYAMNTLMVEDSQNPIDSVISSMLSDKAKSDYKNVLNGMWQRFANKDEFNLMFPNFSVEKSGDSFTCHAGENKAEFSRFALALSDFSQLKDDGESRPSCTSLMQRFQKGQVSIHEFESSVSDMAEKSSLMLDSRIDEKNNAIWEKFDENNVFMKGDGYTCYKLEDDDKEDFISVADDSTKWCVAKPNNTFWEDYGAPYYMIVKGNHIPFALLNISTKHEGASVSDPYVQFMDETDSQITYDRPSYRILISFARKIGDKIGIDLENVGHGYNAAFKMDIGDGTVPKEPDLKESAIRSGNTPQDVLEYLALENQSKYDEFIVSNPNCSANLLRQLMWRNGSSKPMLCRILENERCTDKLAKDILRTFMKSDSDKTNAYASILSRSNVSSSMMSLILESMPKDAFDAFCKNDRIKTEKIIYFLSHGDMGEQQVLGAMRKRLDIPVGAIRKYADRYESIRNECLSMESLEASEIKKICNEIRTVDELISLLGNSNCPSDVLDKAMTVNGLSDDEMKRIAMAVSKNINSPSHALCMAIEMYGSSVDYLTFNAVGNPNADEDVYRTAINSDGFVGNNSVYGMMKRDNFTTGLFLEYEGHCKKFTHGEYEFFMRSDVPVDFIVDMLEKHGELLDFVRKRSDYLSIVKRGVEKGCDLFRQDAVLNGLIEISAEDCNEEDLMNAIENGKCPEKMLKMALMDKSYSLDYVDDKILDAMGKGVAAGYYSTVLFGWLVKRGDCYNLVKLFKNSGCTGKVRDRICNVVFDKHEYFDNSVQIATSEYFTDKMLNGCLESNNRLAVICSSKCPLSTIDKLVSDESASKYDLMNAIKNCDKCTPEMLDRLGSHQLEHCSIYSYNSRFFSSPSMNREDFDKIRSIADDSEGDKLLKDFWFLTNPNCTNEFAMGVLKGLEDSTSGESEHSLMLSKTSKDKMYQIDEYDIAGVIRKMVENYGIEDETIVGFIGLLKNETQLSDVVDAILSSKRILGSAFDDLARKHAWLIGVKAVFTNGNLSDGEKIDVAKKCNMSFCYLSEIISLFGSSGNDLYRTVALIGSCMSIYANDVPMKTVQTIVDKSIEKSNEMGISHEYLLQLRLNDPIEPVTAEKRTIPTGSGAVVKLETTSNRRIINSTIASGSTGQLMLLMNNENVSRKLARKFAEKSNELMDRYYQRFGLDDFVLNSVRFFLLFKKHGADFGKDVLLRLEKNGNDDVRWLARKFLDYLYDESNGLYVNRTASMKHGLVSMRVAVSEFARMLAMDYASGRS